MRKLSGNALLDSIVYSTALLLIVLPAYGVGPDNDKGTDKAPSGHRPTAVDFGPYMAEMQRRIKGGWRPPKVDQSKRVQVIFKIHKSGTLSHLRLDHTSGSPTADQAALKAVTDAAPFRPLPPGSPADVDIAFTFDYNVSGGGSIDDCTKAINLDPKNAAAYLNRGTAYSKLEQHQKAIDDYIRAISLDPKLHGLIEVAAGRTDS